MEYSELIRKGKTMRLPEHCTPEDLEIRGFQVFRYDEWEVLVGYFYRNGPSYFGAIYEHLDSDLSCEGFCQLAAISEEFFKDEGHALKWGLEVMQ